MVLWKDCAYFTMLFMSAVRCWHFHIYEQEKISCSAEFSMNFFFITLGSGHSGLFFFVEVFVLPVTSRNKLYLELPMARTLMDRLPRLFGTRS